MLDQRTVLEPQDQPRDQGLAEAARVRTSLMLIGFASLFACLALFAETSRRAAWPLVSVDLISLRLIAASLALLAGAFLACALVAQARLSARPPERSAPADRRRPPRNVTGKRLLTLVSGAARFLRARFDSISFPSGGLQALLMLAGATTAIVILIRNWPLPAENRPADNVLFMRGALALGAAFPILLAERAYAGFAGWRLPEALALQRLLRLALLVFALEGALALLEGYGFSLSGFVEPVLRLLLLAISGELVLRALAVFFTPKAAPAERRAAVVSVIAGLLTPDAASQVSWRRSLQDQLGIDLSRSWALQYVRSAIGPVAFLLATVAWGLTGVTILGADQRGIYERLGRPVTVFRPGLHFGLPWPLGIVRLVDFGEIHALSLGDANPLVEVMSTLPGPEVVGVEQAAPPSADRLWDESHPSERSYLVASDAIGRSAFQIVDVDVKLIWRVGLGDEAALASAYRAAQPQMFLRAYAGRLLARYFSTRTLLGALGEKREGLSDELRRGLQSALDRSGTGIDLVAVVVEAIHPPAKAADSYHEVQAARIRSEATISEARRRAIEAMSGARRTAMEKIASAQAAAVERVTIAQSDSLRFATDERSYGAAGSPYLFERYLAAIARGFAGAPITLLDHRIAGAGGETIIDMRSFRAVAPPSVPDEDTGEKEPSK